MYDGGGIMSRRACACILRMTDCMKAPGTVALHMEMPLHARVRDIVCDHDC